MQLFHARFGGEFLKLVEHTDTFSNHALDRIEVVFRITARQSRDHRKYDAIHRVQSFERFTFCVGQIHFA